ncbi:unnamed protein product [Cylindrotheca closterium]|uniref:Sulfotransferase n=1 Tax=Cylindrotheca closterium TaxID=2856 RepID=A0AAD2CNJ2_9STRA|nr:unnamed protein product [Cylindrotheca closterium]
MTIFRRQEEQSLNNNSIPTSRQLNGHHHEDEIDVMRPPISHMHGSDVSVESSMKNSPKGKERHRKHEYKMKRAKVTKKKKHQHPEINLPLPVLAVGFPKAGTSSIFSFFQQQKFRSQHWYCCKSQNDPQRGGPFLMADCLLRYMGSVASDGEEKNQTMLQECGHFDVYAEINGPRCDGDKGCRLEDGSVDTGITGPRIFLPQHFNLPELHDSAPNSTWILNTRLVSDWVESVMNWSDLQHQFANEYYSQGRINELPKNAEEMKAFLKEIFLNHTDHVKEFVSRHPSHALIEINITEGDTAGQVLAESFGLDASYWTARNQRWRITWQNSVRFFGGTAGWLMFAGTTAYMCSIIGLAMTML